MSPTATISGSFLSWVRAGVGTAVSNAGGIPRRASLNVGVTVNGTALRDVPLQIYGPGDVVGIDPRLVARTTPLHGSTDFEPNYFPAIEFADPSFPWLFTPAGTAEQKLTPWICLAVVRKQDGVLFEEPDPKQPLPVMVFKGAARPLDELPPLEEAWAWAHTHVLWARDPAAGADEASLAAILRDQPELARSRLVCPRRLEAGAQYYACVVPVFDLGVKAGLGQITAADEASGTLQFAWKTGAPPALPFRLPVYYRWEFTAGAAGDFESLVRRIVKRTTLPGVGERLIDVSDAGPAALGMPGVVLGLEGALRPAGMTPRAWDAVVRGRFESALTPLLNAGALATTSASAGEPIVAPPLYGSAQTRQQTVPAATHPLAWMRALNLDPRTRAAAAFGTAVVQRDQEALMASAWAQLAEVRRLNALMRQAQLAREIAAVTHRERLSALAAPAMLAVARATLTRVGTADPSAAGITTLATSIASGVQTLAAVRTFHAWVAESAIGAGAVSPAFQAVSRPGGPVARRLFTAPVPVRAEVVKRLNAGRIAAARPRPLPDKTVTMDEVTNRLVADVGTKYANVRLGAAEPGQFFPEMLGWADGWLYHNTPTTSAPIAPAIAEMIRDDRDYYEPRAPRLPSRDSTIRAALNRQFREAAVAHQRYLLNARSLTEPVTPPPPRDLDAMKKQLLIALDPEATFKKRMRGRVADAPATVWNRPDALDAVLVSPRYPQGMSEPLRRLSPELILPGAEHVPPDTLAVLRPNHAFIEAYLTGLNQEISRELIWRGYPGDVTSTPFRHFWQSNGAEDVAPIRDWRQPLGGNVGGASARSPLVLLLRTELLHRYPSARVFAAKAIATSSGRAPGPVQEAPLFRGSIDPDIAFFGFAFTEAQAKGTGIGDDLGYYFVIEQQPSAPVFGLAAEKTSGGLPRWRALAWGDLPIGTHARATATVSTPASPENLFWGQNAANTAAITERPPVRVARHFSLILSATR
jgi:hypothetical protein